MSVVRRCSVLLLLLLVVVSQTWGSATCPPPCTCQAEEVRCENSMAMTQLPQHLSNNDTLRTLLITRVNITSLTPSSFAHLRQLTSLDLHNSGIALLAGGAFQDLSQLQTLVLRRNNLKHLSNQTFVGLEGLKVLDLSWNCFVELDQRWFQNLTGLEVLDLSRNAIELIQNDAFFGLGNLQNLNLARNKLITLSNAYLAPLTSLRTLTVDDNSILLIENDSFSAQMFLTRLSLTGNRDLTSVQANAFVFQPKVLRLEELSLKGTHLKEVPVDMLKSLPELKTLDLSQTAISVVRERSFSTQSNLRNLTLAWLPRLHSIESQAFEGLTRLETLVISNNQLLNDISWGVFRNLTQLRYLDLHNNKLETLRSGQADWSKIDVVDLRGNPLRCDCHTGWILSLLRDNSSQAGSGAEGPRGGLPANITCSNSSAAIPQGKTVVSTAAFTRQIRCHMPPDLHGACLASLTVQQLRCPRAPAPRSTSRHDDRRLIVAVVAASVTCFFLLLCGLVLKFRRRLMGTCSRQYRYTAHWNHGMNGASPSADNGDIVELETTQLEDFDSDIDTSARP